MSQLHLVQANFYTHQTGDLCAGMCTCDLMHQMEKTDNSASNINQVFAAMFSDSKIAGSFQVGPDNLKHICTSGLALFFKTILAEKLKKIRTLCH